MVAAATAAAASPAGMDLAIRRISHHFELQGEILPVLDEISVRVEPGDMLALLGPSGCGKSTLLRLVAGLEMPRSGDILADGVPMPDPIRHAWWCSRTPPSIPGAPFWTMSLSASKRAD